VRVDIYRVNETVKACFTDCDQPTPATAICVEDDQRETKQWWIQNLNPPLLGLSLIVFHFERESGMGGTRIFDVGGSDRGANAEGTGGKRKSPL